MNRIILKNALFICFIIVFVFSALIAQPTKASVLKAWETLQINNPKTIVFEKLEDSLYKFKTEQFPFDGKLKVLNVTVDDRWGDTEYGSIMGVIEVELVDLPTDFLQKHAYSYSMWTQNNILYYDKKTDKWMNSKEYYAKTQKKFKRGPLGIFGDLFSDVPFIILIVVFFILIFITAKMQRKNERYMNNTLDLQKKSLELSEKMNQVLKEISEALKRK